MNFFSAFLYHNNSDLTSPGKITQSESLTSSVDLSSKTSDSLDSSSLDRESSEFKDTNQADSVNNEPEDVVEQQHIAITNVKENFISVKNRLRYEKNSHQANKTPFEKNDKKKKMKDCCSLSHVKNQISNVHRSLIISGLPENQWHAGTIVRSLQLAYKDHLLSKLPSHLKDIFLVAEKTKDGKNSSYSKTAWLINQQPLILKYMSRDDIAHLCYTPPFFAATAPGSSISCVTPLPSEVAELLSNLTGPTWTTVSCLTEEVASTLSSIGTIKLYSNSTPHPDALAIHCSLASCQFLQDKQKQESDSVLSTISVRCASIEQQISLIHAALLFVDSNPSIPARSAVLASATGVPYYHLGTLNAKSVLDMDIFRANSSHTANENKKSKTSSTTGASSPIISLDFVASVSTDAPSVHPNAFAGSEISRASYPTTHSSNQTKFNRISRHSSKRHSKNPRAFQKENPDNSIDKTNLVNNQFQILLNQLSNYPQTFNIPTYPNSFSLPSQHNTHTNQASSHTSRLRTSSCNIHNIPATTVNDLNLRANKDNIHGLDGFSFPNSDLRYNARNDTANNDCGVSSISSNTSHSSLVSSPSINQQTLNNAALIHHQMRLSFASSLSNATFYASMGLPVPNIVMETLWQQHQMMSMQLAAASSTSSIHSLESSENGIK